MLHVEGSEIRRVRVALGEDQTKFGKRYGKTRRTIIRWEQKGTHFSDWGFYNWKKKKNDPTDADRWKALAAKADARAAKKLAKAQRKAARKGVTRRRRRRVSRVTKRAAPRGGGVTRRRKTRRKVRHK